MDVIRLLIAATPAEDKEELWRKACALSDSEPRFWEAALLPVIVQAALWPTPSACVAPPYRLGSRDARRAEQRARTPSLSGRQGPLCRIAQTRARSIRPYINFSSSGENAETWSRDPRCALPPEND